MKIVTNHIETVEVEGKAYRALVEISFDSIHAFVTVSSEGTQSQTVIPLLRWQRSSREVLRFVNRHKLIDATKKEVEQKLFETLTLSQIT